MTDGFYNFSIDDAFEKHSEDFGWCEEVIKQHSRSFYAAFSSLPRKKSLSVYAVYAFCRYADDCVDEARSREQLLKLRREFVLFTQGENLDSPLWRALRVVFDEYDMEKQAFFDMLTGQESDLSFSQPSILVELEDYCYYVAGSVGLMLLPILCTEHRISSYLRESAIALGVAMQITNILRDVGEDLEKGRIYLPSALMKGCAYSNAELRQHILNSEFILLWETLARRAEELYPRMEERINELDDDSRFPTLSALYLYRGILDQVRAEGYPCLERRSSVPDATKILLLAEAEAALAQNATKHSKGFVAFSEIDVSAVSAEVKDDFDGVYDGQ